MLAHSIDTHLASVKSVNSTHQVQVAQDPLAANVSNVEQLKQKKYINIYGSPGVGWLQALLDAGTQMMSPVLTVSSSTPQLRLPLRMGFS